MKKFEAKLHENQNELGLELSGAIGHECLLPEINPLTHLLIVDMEKILSINSFGINIWMKWVAKNKGLKKIVLNKVPTIFIKQLQYFRNLISANIEIQSFFVPYYLEVPEEKKVVLFVQGTHYEKGLFINLPTVLGSTNSPMSIDVDVDKFFAFLKAPINGQH